MGSSWVRRFCLIKIARDRIVSGAFVPLPAIVLGQKVENFRGSLVSGSHRTTPWPRVHPLLITWRRSGLSTNASSASSMTNVGCHLSIERYRAAALIPTLKSERRTIKLTTPIKVDLPESRSAEVTNKIGE